LFIPPSGHGGQGACCAEKLVIATDSLKVSMPLRDRMPKNWLGNEAMSTRQQYRHVCPTKWLK
jgi:hypothetical protein